MDFEWTSNRTRPDIDRIARSHHSAHPLIGMLCAADWYMIPDKDRGQLTSPNDPYLRVNESALLLRDGSLILGEENEEYAQNWASEWRTFKPGERGGDFDASAPQQGHHARYGPYRSFAYRYLVSSLRILQMRVNYLLASPVVVNPALYSYMALEIGRTAADAPDAWCFLVSAHFKWGIGVVSNFERWLTQRAAPAADGGGIRAYPDGRITQTPAPPSNHTWMTEYKHDWLAMRADGGVLGFAIDRVWASSAASPLHDALIKVTLFDVHAGDVSVVVIAENGEGASPPKERQLDSLPTIGDGDLKTLTFVASKLDLRPAVDTAYPFDFEVRAVDRSGAMLPLVVSMVRVIKLGDPGGDSGRDTAITISIIVMVLLVGLMISGALMMVRRKHTRFAFEGFFTRTRIPLAVRGVEVTTTTTMGTDSSAKTVSVWPPPAPRPTWPVAGSSQQV